MLPVFHSYCMGLSVAEEPGIEGSTRDQESREECAPAGIDPQATECHFTRACIHSG